MEGLSACCRRIGFVAVLVSLVLQTQTLRAERLGGEMESETSFTSLCDAVESKRYQLWAYLIFLGSIGGTISFLFLPNSEMLVALSVILVLAWLFNLIMWRRGMISRLKSAKWFCMTHFIYSCITNYCAGRPAKWVLLNHHAPVAFVCFAAVVVGTEWALLMLALNCASFLFLVFIPDGYFPDRASWFCLEVNY